MGASSFDRLEFYHSLRLYEDRVIEAAEQRLRELEAHYPVFRHRISGIAKRTMAVERAMNESEAIALQDLRRSLGNISIDAIWPLLRHVCHDFALYTGGGAIVGGAVGAGVGVFLLGAGVVPGLAAGAVLGAQAGNLLLVFLGLKSVVTYMADSIPKAAHAYWDGVREAWGQDPDWDDEWRRQGTRECYLAAKEIARGHEIFVLALLTGIVAYLTLGRGNLQRLLSEVRESARLGPKMAEWLEQNSQKLIYHPSLRIRTGRNGAVERGATAGSDPGSTQSKTLEPKVSVHEPQARPSARVQRLKYKPSSGVILQGREGVTTTVVGSYKQDMAAIVNEMGNVKSTDFGPRVGQLNVLNVPDSLYVSPKQFWSEYNAPWLNSAIERGDDILLATPPSFVSLDAKAGANVLMRENPTTGKMELTGFGREYLTLRRSGFVYDNGVMRKTP